MVRFEGEEKLKRDTAMVQKPEAVKLSNEIYALKYYGSSNATLVIGETSCILIDCFENDYNAKLAKEEIKKITSKPVKTIIYTHMHADHIGGAQVFQDTVETVVAHSSNGPVIKRQELIEHDAKRRMIHQFGFGLTKEESLSMGLNPAVEQKGEVVPLAPTKILTEAVTELEIDGVNLTCIHAPGETDEQQYIWLKKSSIVCCGDNYYASWPNLSALRGSQYRDVDLWVTSLEKLISLQGEILLPGHGDTLIGQELICETLTNYHDAIEWVLVETLKGIDAGRSPDELVAEIKLPDQWKNLRYLQEYYGTVAWSVRGIYAGYVGWFDGNPTNIGSIAPETKAQKIVALCGVDKIIQEIQKSLEKKNTEDMQWACELCDVLIQAGEKELQAKQLKAEACVFLGRMQTSANGRHYYLSCAKSIQNSLKEDTLSKIQ